MTTGIANITVIAGNIWDSITGENGYLNMVLTNGVLLLPIGFMFCRRIVSIFGRMVGIGGSRRRS